MLAKLVFCVVLCVALGQVSKYKIRTVLVPEPGSGAIVVEINK